MMKRRSINARAFWVTMLIGFVTGMGNGSVFGAALMCWMGRGPFEDWGGGVGIAPYLPTTFAGFMNFWMFVFGFAFVAMMMIAFKRHDELEHPPALGRN